MCVAKWYFAFATNGGFIFKACWIKDHFHENLKHWGVRWIYSIELLSSDHFFLQVCPLGTLHFFTSKGLGDICSNTYLILDFENLSLHPGFSIYSRSQFLSLHDRAMTRGITASPLLEEWVWNARTCICLLNCGGCLHERIIRIIPVRRYLQMWVPLFLLSLMDMVSLSPTWRTLGALNSQDPQFELCNHLRDNHMPQYINMINSLPYFKCCQNLGTTAE